MLFRSLLTSLLLAPAVATVTRVVEKQITLNKRAENAVDEAEDKNVADGDGDNAE